MRRASSGSVCMTVIWTDVPRCLRVMLTRCSCARRTRSAARPPPSARPTPATAVRRSACRREGPRGASVGFSVAIDGLGAEVRNRLMLVVLAGLDLDQMRHLFQIVPAHAGALDQLDLALVAAHALLEVDGLAPDRARRAGVLAHRAD